MELIRHKKIEDFIHTLKGALEEKGRSASEILDEVTADLEAHLDRYQAQGHSKNKSVELALEEMGNPYELAHHMCREASPFGGPVLTKLRYLAAAGIFLWVMVVLYYFRAWTYGFNPFMYGVVALFHVPAILLLWPRLVWKQNWMFGILPAGLALLVSILMSSSGTQSTAELKIPLGTEIPSEITDTSALLPGAQTTDPKPVYISLACTIMLLALFWALQQKRQRMIVLGTIACVIVGTEMTFQIEEMLFRKDRNTILTYVTESLKHEGSYPTREALFSKHSDVAKMDLAYRENQDGFTIFWNRPLNSGFAIVYSSSDERTWIQD